MIFSVKKINNELQIFHNGKLLIDGIQLEILTQRHGTYPLTPGEIQIDHSQTVVTLVGEERVTFAKLIFSEIDRVLQVFVSIQTIQNDYKVNYYLASSQSIRLFYHFARHIDANYITEISTKLWFQTPSFSRDLADLPPQTQDIHILSGGEHIHMLPLVSDDFRSEFKKDALVASVGCGGISQISGYLMTVAVENDPYEAIKSNFNAGRKSGAIKVPLRKDRYVPQIFNRIGWCTWDAFYRDLSAEKIYQKLEELKSKNIQLGFLLIDDGWSPTENMRLLSLYEDRQKFPEGLAACIKHIKEEYGVKYVGVWQAFNGYWKGIMPESSLAKELSDLLISCPNGLLIVSPDPDKNYAFWNKWHTYLASCGVDFVKVDNQTTYSYYIDEVCKNVQAIRGAHEGLERSVFEHFRGNLINCMGMGIQDLFTRPRSGMNRNSNDFSPQAENGFSIHIQSNAYNAPVHGQMMCCDYDMWWTNHESGKAHSVLRAISGGPIYVSDRLNETDPTYLRPLTDREGEILQLDLQGMPTYDCFYVDCEKNAIPLKLFNRAGENFAVAAFGISNAAVKGTLRLSDIPGASGRYLAREYFSGAEICMDSDTEIPIVLEKLDVMLWNLYPVKNGIAKVGSPDVYMGCASLDTHDVKVTHEMMGD